MAMKILEKRSRNENYFIWKSVSGSGVFTPNKPVNESHVISDSLDWPVLRSGSTHTSPSIADDLGALRDAISEPGDSMDYEALRGEIGL